MEALRCLPGVGPKSAQRMAFHLLQRDRKGGLQLADALSQAMTEIGHCNECRTFTEEDTCHICTNPKRQENGQICVVESPADIAAIEATGAAVETGVVYCPHPGGKLAIAVGGVCLLAGMRAYQLRSGYKYLKANGNRKKLRKAHKLKWYQ